MLVCDDVVIRQDAFTLRASWQVAAGDKLAVIGPSGAGKSTLLNAIAGFVPLSGGRLSWAGQDLGALDPGARPLTILFQDQNLFPHLTLAQNVALGLSPSLRLDRASKERVEAALERVGLGGLGARRPAQVSGGQASRTALARALLRQRPLLLLDEPFAALGPGLKTEMLSLVAEIVAETGATLLMVTHDPADARHAADRVVFVDDGVADPPRPTEKVFAAPSPRLAAYLGTRR